MYKVFSILFLLPFMLVSCDENTDITSGGIIPSHQEKSRNMSVVKTSFAVDSTKIYVFLDHKTDPGQYNFEDRKQVKIKVKEYDYEMSPVSGPGQPTFLSFKNIGIEQLKQSGLVVNALVDLTQPVSVLNQQKDYIYKMSKDLCKDNLYLTFMYAFGKRSPTMLATPYVIENYISHGQQMFDESDSIGLPYIYRTVNSVINEMENSYEEPWVNAKYKALLIFSDGVVYNGNTNLPLDPGHFVMQQNLVQLSHHFPDNFTVSYVDLAPENTDPNIIDVNMMRMLCSNTHGQFYDSFSWTTMKQDIKATFNIHYPDYLVTLNNPEEKIYSGNKRYLKIAFTNAKDSLLAQAVTSYSMGSVYDPVCIGPYTEKYILLRGIVYGGLLLLVVYFLAQIIIPYISYRWFRKKYVARYKGPDMVLNTIKVPHTCYYCKAPFKVGEFVVAKCKHVMHEDCWNENDYHCPEYGIHCKEGSHYYNQHNMLDPKNASYYLKWFLISTLAGIIAWILYLHVDYNVIFYLLENILCYIFDITNPNNTRAVPLNLDIMTSKMYMLPRAGIYITFWLTMALSYLSSHHTKWYHRTGEILLRTIVACILAFLWFLFEDFIIILGNLYEYSRFLDWIPWTISAFIITDVSTIHTRIHTRHIYMLIAAAGGFVSTLFWEIFGNIDTINEELMLLICNAIFVLSITISIARDLPRHEHYFLHVNGEIKEMDIALYKWLRQSPESIAYIGRSVDCHLQITWDIMSDIAPVHAAVVNNHGAPQLKTMDGDVFLNGKPIKEDKLYDLYHGDSFQIGTTTFKYVEM